jgi:transposase
MDSKCILAVLPTRERDALENWIDGLSEQQRKSIRFVSTDMWAPYRQTAQRKLGHATLQVLDYMGSESPIHRE